MLRMQPILELAGDHKRCAACLFFEKFPGRANHLKRKTMVYAYVVDGRLDF